MPCIWWFVVPYELSRETKKCESFSDKKCEEGKPFKVAVIACVTKLFALLFQFFR